MVIIDPLDLAQYRGIEPQEPRYLALRIMGILTDIDHQYLIGNGLDENGGSDRWAVCPRVCGRWPLGGHPTIIG